MNVKFFEGRESQSKRAGPLGWHNVMKIPSFSKIMLSIVRGIHGNKFHGDY